MKKTTYVIIGLIAFYFVAITIGMLTMKAFTERPRELRIACEEAQEISVETIEADADEEHFFAPSIIRMKVGDDRYYIYTLSGVSEREEAPAIDATVTVDTITPELTLSIEKR